MDIDYRALLQATPCPLLILEPDPPRFTIIDVSDVYNDATMTDRAGLIGRSMFEVFPDNPADPDAHATQNLRASLEHVLATRRPHSMAIQKYDIRRPDGSFEERYWLAVNMPVIAPSGEVTALIHHVDDVTEYVRHCARDPTVSHHTRRLEAQVVAATQKLRELNATLEEQVARRTMERDQMWRLSMDIFAVVSPDGIIQAINPAISRLGYAPEDLVGKHLWTIADGEHRTETANALAAATKTVVTNVVTGARAADGSCHWISWTIAPGEEMVFAVGRDVTEEQARAAELAQVQEALRQSQKLEAMGQLTGGVAHDFNNLLTPIIGSLDILQRRGLCAEPAQRLLDGALQSAERARTLVQRLLAFARRQPLNATSVDIAQLINGMTELIASTSGPRVKLVVDIAPGLPAATADAHQIEMAILNLSVNARDAMPDGGTLTISAHVEKIGRNHQAGLKPGEYVRLSIADTGTGMDEATLARAIEPFFSTKGIGKGTGLGLSMAHGVAGQLGGALRLTSKPGLGTQVDLWLPAAKARSATVGMPASDHEQPATGRVLLVEDDDLVRVSTAAMLTDLGYDVVEASSGEEALTLIEQGVNPHLLITDHLMPGISGTDLARGLRARWPHIRVLIISGYAELEGVAADLPRLVKPFRAAELVSALAKLDASNTLNCHGFPKSSAM